MFIKSFKLFESVDSKEIIGKKDFIRKKWDLEVKMRTGSSNLIDIYIIINGELSPRAVYDIEKQEFILIYRDMLSGPLPPSKWIRIKSDDFFDRLDRVVGYIYNDV